MTIEQIIEHNMIVSARKDAERIAEELIVPAYWHNRILMQFHPTYAPCEGMHVECELSTGNAKIRLKKNDIRQMFEFFKLEWPEVFGDAPHVDRNGRPSLNAHMVHTVLKGTGLFDQGAELAEVETWSYDQLRSAWEWAAVENNVFGDNGIPEHVRKLVHVAGKEQ